MHTLTCTRTRIHIHTRARSRAHKHTKRHTHSIPWITREMDMTLFHFQDIVDILEGYFFSDRIRCILLTENI